MKKPRETTNQTGAFHITDVVMIQEKSTYKTPPRPVPLPVIPENIPPDLRSLPQWVCWRYELRKPKNGTPKWTKPPICALSGHYGKSNDPATWTNFESALSTYQGMRLVRDKHGNPIKFDGIGFAFSEGDGLTGIDLDHVLDPDTGELAPWAIDIMERFNGAYREWSPSREGLRIYCRGVVHRCGKGTLLKSVELYDWNSPRYLTVTGHRYE